MLRSPDTQARPKRTCPRKALASRTSGGRGTGASRRTSSKS